MSKAVLTCNVAIFAHRETVDSLQRTLNAVLQEAPLQVDLLINGNAGLAKAMAAALSAEHTNAAATRVRVWQIAFGDKAHAWNQYVHTIWPGNADSFNIDGYVHLRAGSLARLQQRLSVTPGALAATGVPSGSRASRDLAKAMLQQGGLHGNLFLMSVDTVHRLRRNAMRLPLGLYRTDATIGAWLAVDLDPEERQWRLQQRVVVDADVTWDVDAAPRWQWATLRGQLRRKIRQAQGELENCAIRQLWRGRRLRVEQWPNTAADAVRLWLAECPDEARSLLIRRPLTRLALRSLLAPRDWSAAAIPPQLVFERG